MRWKWTEKGVLLLISQDRCIHAAVYPAKGDGYRWGIKSESGAAHHSETSYDTPEAAAEVAMDTLGFAD